MQPQSANILLKLYQVKVFQESARSDKDLLGHGNSLSTYHPKESEEPHHDD